MSKATPRPWRIARSHEVVTKNPCIVADTDHDAVLFITELETERGKANAELIVKAVNRDHLFEELADKLEGVLKYHSTTFSSQLRSDIRDLLRRARGE